MKWCVFIWQWLCRSHVRLRQAYARLHATFPEHEIYVRSKGRVRFLRVTTRFQLRSLALALCLSFLWLGFSGRLMLSQYHVRAERAAISAKARAVEAASQQVEAVADDITHKTRQLEMRQQLMEQAVRQYFGTDMLLPSSQAPKESEKRAALSEPASPEGASEALQSLAHIQAAQNHMVMLEKRQAQNAAAIARMAQSRLAQARSLARRSGVNPDLLLEAPPAMGGPYMPLQWLWSTDKQKNEPIYQMGRALAALDQLERGFLNLPSHRPVQRMILSSGFGFRFDPFTHWPAMHMGQDLIGAEGAPIYAAGAGRVAQAGWSSGYGRLIVIDHGSRIATRYGHLARFLVAPGQRVRAGQIIGLMGSSGRSTGTHLHFELRVQGRAINPVYLLREMPNVFKIQKRTQQRLADAATGS